VRTRIEADLEVFSQAMEASPDGLVLLDTDDHIVWCNRVAEQHLGLRGERDVGLPVANLVRFPGFAEFLAGAKEGESLTCRPQDKQGQGVLSIEVVRFGSDRRLLISFDMTQIERAEAMRRDFVANVSHELRTPLTVISGFIEHMHDDPDPDPAEAAAEHDGRAGAAHAAPGRRPAYAVTARGRGTVAGRGRTSTCATSSTTSERGAASSPVAAIRSPARWRPAFLKGSREDLRSAFSNLVSNAVRYTPAGGRILLRWMLRDGKGVFSVEDSGIGIPEEHLPRLAERFYRVDRGRSRASGGTGLGLAIVKHRLLRHQATLEITSVFGAGSMFSAVFPAWRVQGATGEMLS
jgi:two-component system phosphate regulon sensor histidine kinase PhoR